MVTLINGERESITNLAITPDEMKRCPDCGKLLYAGLIECRYCSHRFVDRTETTQSPDEELCPDCGQHMLFDESASERYCPIDHSQSLLDV